MTRIWEDGRIWNWMSSVWLPEKVGWHGVMSDLPQSTVVQSVVINVVFEENRFYAKLFHQDGVHEAIVSIDKHRNWEGLNIKHGLSFHQRTRGDPNRLASSLSFTRQATVWWPFSPQYKHFPSMYHLSLSWVVKQVLPNCIGTVRVVSAKDKNNKNTL